MFKLGRAIFSSVVVLFCALPWVAQAGVLVNPIVPNPDPFITRVGSQYILLATTGRNISLWAGPRMESLSSGRKVLWTPSATDPVQQKLTQIWSPTLWQFGDRWWIYFTATYDNANSGHGIYALRSVTNDPLGAWEFAGLVDTGMPAIDPSVLQVKGKSYLMFVSVMGRNLVWIAPLASPMQLERKANLLITPEHAWEKQSGDIVEGPTALYHAGKIFIVYSASHTESPAYCLGLLTYSGKGEITDPANWKKTGPVFEQLPEKQVYGPGRGTFTTSPDGKESWLLYAAKSVGGLTGAGRTVRAQPFTYDKNGMPEFGKPVAAGVEIAVPSGEVAP